MQKKEEMGLIIASAHASSLHLPIAHDLCERRSQQYLQVAIYLIYTFVLPVEKNNVLWEPSLR